MRKQGGRLLLLCGFCLICLICALWWELGDVFPPINVQPSSLMGYWQAEYVCSAEKARIVEVLALQDNYIYKQTIVKEEEIIYQIQGRWRIERVAPRSVWLHLEGGRYYVGECLESINSCRLVDTMDWSWHRVTFDTCRETVLSIWQPAFSRDVFLEYLLGDPDSPIVVRFARRDKGSNPSPARSVIMTCAGNGCWLRIRRIEGDVVFSPAG